jgi:hypothetical protein
MVVKLHRPTRPLQRLGATLQDAAARTRLHPSRTTGDSVHARTMRHADQARSSAGASSASKTPAERSMSRSPCSTATTMNPADTAGTNASSVRHDDVWLRSANAQSPPVTISTCPLM